MAATEEPSQVGGVKPMAASTAYQKSDQSGTVPG